MPELPPPKPERAMPPKINLDEIITSVRVQIRTARRDGLQPHRVLLPYTWQIELDGEADRRRGADRTGLRHIYEVPVQFRRDIYKPVLEAFRPMEVKRYLLAVTLPERRA
jgi:hypothetical protein